MNETKQQLIQHAIHVIDQNGFENLSLRKLTGALGLTTGAFYKHFKDKDELFKIIVIELSKEFVTNIDFKRDSPEEQLLQIADYFVQQMQEHPYTMDFLFFSDQSVAALKNKDMHYPFLSKILQLINQINIQSNLSNREFFIQIWSFIQGYSFLIKKKVTSYNPDFVRTTLIQMIQGVK